MKHTFTNKDGIGQLILIKEEPAWSQYYYKKESGYSFHTLAWNRGETQKITIDNVQFNFEKDTILPLMLNQSFSFEHPETVTAWQFNREFYCIVNHDREVGCVGFIFFGPTPTMFVKLEAEDSKMLNLLLGVFEDELLSDDEIKEEMLRMLLVRLIIKVTRLAKKQYLKKEEVNDEKFSLIRQYNLLVEIHFRKEHQVSFYANLLHKSPKTISNYFSLYGTRSPVQIIHQRIITEAKRLFYYTDKTVGEIADELGFSDIAHFSKFFKNSTSLNPSEIRKSELHGSTKE